MFLKSWFYFFGWVFLLIFCFRGSHISSGLCGLVFLLVTLFLPPRDVHVFSAWEVAWGNVLTFDQLIPRERILGDWCNLCKGDERLANHVLLHCGAVGSLWILLFFVLAYLGWCPCWRESLWAVGGAVYLLNSSGKFEICALCFFSGAYGRSGIGKSLIWWTHWFWGWKTTVLCLCSLEPVWKGSLLLLFHQSVVGLLSFFLWMPLPLWHILIIFFVLKNL